MAQTAEIIESLAGFESQSSDYQKSAQGTGVFKKISVNTRLAPDDWARRGQMQADGCKKSARAWRQRELGLQKSAWSGLLSGSPSRKRVGKAPGRASSALFSTSPALIFVSRRMWPGERLR